MVKFGPSGNSQIFYNAGNKTSIDAPKWLKEVGLQAYEYSFGRGYRMSMETAERFGKEAEKYDIAISIHAPYYINFANLDDLMIEKSFSYIMRGFEYVKAMKGTKLVFHLASQGNLKREEALLLVNNRLDDCLERIYARGMQSFYLCPETMGKHSQIGTYKEVIDLCTKDKILMPTFDFGHINSVMAGGLKSKEDYKKIFDYSFEKLGEFRTKNSHIHFSKIQYSEKGEVRHLNYNDTSYGPDFEPLSELICEYNLTPTIICESKDYMAEDALTYQKIYNDYKTTLQNTKKML